MKKCLAILLLVLALVSLCTAAGATGKISIQQKATTIIAGIDFPFEVEISAPGASRIETFRDDDDWSADNVSAGTFAFFYETPGDHTYTVKALFGDQWEEETRHVTVHAESDFAITEYSVPDKYTPGEPYTFTAKLPDGVDEIRHEFTVYDAQGQITHGESDHTAGDLSLTIDPYFLKENGKITLTLISILNERHIAPQPFEITANPAPPPTPTPVPTPDPNVVYAITEYNVPAKYTPGEPYTFTAKLPAGADEVRHELEVYDAQGQLMHGQSNHTPGDLSVTIDPYFLKADGRIELVLKTIYDNQEYAPIAFTITANPEPTPTPAPVAPIQGYTDPTTGVTVDIAVTNGNPTATYTKPAKSAATVKVPDTVTVDGQAVPVTKIADKAFQKDTKLKTLTIGKNVTTIGKNAFASCTKLKTIKGGAAVTSIGANAFKGDKVLTSISLKKVKTIGSAAFSGCVKLKKVTLGSSVTTIGANAFKGCKVLTAITIPAKVNSIGKNAFNGCAKLKTITIKTTKLTTKNVGAGAFKGIYKKATFKVPKAKVKAYKTLVTKKGAPKTVKVK